jgi:hypothetical protein
MEWLSGLALLPALVCGGMMLGGAALAAFGLRRTGGNTRSSTPPDTGADTRASERVPDELAR